MDRGNRIHISIMALKTKTMNTEDIILVIGFIVFVLFITWCCLVKHTLNKVNGMPKYKNPPKAPKKNFERLNNGVYIRVNKPKTKRSDYKPPRPTFPKNRKDL